MLTLWLEYKRKKHCLKKIIQIVPENNTYNIEASTSKCSAAHSFFEILTKLL